MSSMPPRANSDEPHDKSGNESQQRSFSNGGLPRQGSFRSLSPCQDDQEICLIQAQLSVPVGPGGLDNNFTIE